MAPQRIRIAGAGILALLFLAVLGVYLSWRHPVSPQCAQASIAVLPFANLSGDPTQEYFSDGTTEDITSALGRFSDLGVIANVAVQVYKGKSVKHDEINRDLGVCYVLTGSVRKSGDRVLVTAQLIDALSGRLLWSDQYDGDLKDLPTMRNQITLSVVGKLAIKIQDLEKRRALKKPTDSLDAYDLVLRGRDASARNTRAASIEARKLFEQAIQLDPNYASAYAALGITRLNDVGSGWTEFPNDAIRQAESFAQKAIELDKDNAEAHRVLSTAYFSRGQSDLAIREGEGAIELNPSDAASYAHQGTILVYTGHSREAIAEFEIAKRLNPGLGSGRNEPVGWAYYLERRYDEAVTVFTAGVSTAPNDFYIHAGLAASYAQLGRKDLATQAAADVLRTWPFFRIDRFILEFQSEADRALIAEGLHKAGLT